MNHSSPRSIGTAAALAVAIAGIAPLSAGEPTPQPVVAPAAGHDSFSGELHVGYDSQYDFRFVDLGQDLAEAGLDLAFDFGNGWSLNAGAWFGSTNDSPQSFDELDLYAGLGFDLGWGSFEAGYYYYCLPDLKNADSRELYLKTGFGLPWELSLESTIYWDFRRYSGIYVDTNLNRSFEITERLGLDLSVGFGYNDGNSLQISFKNPLGTCDGYQGWYATASLPWKITETLTFSPYVKYTHADSDLVTDGKGTSHGKQHLVGGAMLSVSF